MKERLDILVMENGFAASREKAKAIIMAGEIFVNGQKEDKAGMKFPTDAVITYKGNPIPFVGRGGLKLAKAVKVFHIDLEGKTCMDVGASTGGFTDCMLQNGAVKVYSVDVGYGQLAWKLREDPRVVCMEKTNIRYVTTEDIEERPSFVSIDVSFISLTKVLTPVRDLMTEDGQIVCLIKPQFEAGREKVGKKGVVREPKVHEEVIYSVALYAQSIGFEILSLDYSPIKGPEGNIEYLIYMRKAGSDMVLNTESVSENGNDEMSAALVAEDSRSETDTVPTPEEDQNTTDTVPAPEEDQDTTDTVLTQEENKNATGLALSEKSTESAAADEETEDQEAETNEAATWQVLSMEEMPALIAKTVKKAHEQLRSK